MMVGRRELCFAVAAVILVAVSGPACADSPEDSIGFDTLLGTWIYSEYDGLVPCNEECTWRADGTLLFYDSNTRLFRLEGPFTVAEKRDGIEGGVTLVLVDGSYPGIVSLLVEINSRGDRCTVCKVAGDVRRSCRCFLRKKIYRGIPRHRLDTIRRGVRYADYPFKPDRVMPCTKYFWAKA